MGKLFGWLWTVFCGVGAMGAFVQGEIGAGYAALISSICALPPLWAKLSDQGVVIPIAARWISGAIAFVAFALLLPKTEPKEEIITLASLETKIGKDAVTVMSKSDYDKTYAKLGQEAFDRANTLVKWAAISTVASDSCNRLEIIDISDQSTVEQLQWFADCQNGERFQITEEQATDTQRFWDQNRDDASQDKNDKAEAEALKALAEADKTLADAREVLNGSTQSNDENRPTVQPNSTAVDALDTADEAIIVGSCDQAIRAVYGAYDPSWSYKYSKHRMKGRVSVGRDFEASNAFGGTVPHRYECLVDAATKDLISLRVRHPSGWRTLFSR